MSGNSTDKSNSNNSRGTGSALSMARERLQSSAREWIRNIEDAMLSTSSATQSSANASMRDNNVSQRREIQPSFKEGAASIEQAFRIMFASCTGAADANARELEEKSTSTQTPSSDMQSSDSKSCPPMVTPSHSRRYTVPTVSTPSTAPSTRSPPTLKPPPPSQRDFGEHIYAQLFHDDNSRARKAVASLRTEPDINEPPLGRRQPLTPAAATPMYSYPKPFPMSSPPRTSAVPSQELTLPSNLTFDDSISAISAHTLEAMAHHAPRIRSDLTFSSKDSSTLFPPQSSLQSFPRVQSQESSRSGLISKGGSQKSKTTHTTESSGTSFEIWQAQEKEYWNDVVMQEERQKKPDNKTPHNPAEHKAPRSPPNWFKRGRKATRHPHDGFAPFADTPFIQPIVKHDFSNMDIDEYEVEIDQDDVAEI